MPSFSTSAVETIEGIRLIKRELPGVLTSLGVSNVSFGLKPAARAALNSVFLHHCVEAGLDCALVHPKEITPYAEIEADVRELCDDLVFNRRPDALRAPHRALREPTPSSGDERDAATPTTKSCPIAQQIHNAILRRRKDGIEAKIDEALRERTPVDVLNEILLPAMKDVGDQFGRGELILPFVLQSAEVMKKAVAHLEQFLEKKEGSTKGTVVLATVFGDVHDIGKNLVNTILTNNGYTVHDLGKQVPMNTILEKAVEVNADAIGLSALLVSTSKQMPICVQEQDARGLHFPGHRRRRRDQPRFRPAHRAARRRRALLRARPLLREGRVRRPRDHGRAHRRSQTRRDAFVERDARAKPSRNATSASRGDARVPAADDLGDQERASPTFRRRRSGARATIEDIDLRELWPCFDLKSLYRLSWGASNTKGEAFDALVRDEFEPRLRALPSRSASAAVCSQPNVVYGYFPAAGVGNDVILYDPARPDARDRALPVPAPDRRRTSQPRRLLARAGRRRRAVDVVALQVVTVGAARDGTHRSAASAPATTASRISCTASPCKSAEALAEYTHRRIRARARARRRAAANAIRGATARVPTSSSTRSSFALLDATVAASA